MFLERLTVSLAVSMTNKIIHRCAKDASGILSPPKQLALQNAIQEALYQTFEKIEFNKEMIEHYEYLLERIFKQKIITDELKKLLDPDPTIAPSNQILLEHLKDIDYGFEYTGKMTFQEFIDTFVIELEKSIPKQEEFSKQINLRTLKSIDNKKTDQIKILQDIRAKLDSDQSKTKPILDKEPKKLYIPLPPKPFLDKNPHQLHENFTGRITQKAHINDWLLSNQQPVYVLHGIGGIGKSSLVWHWLKHDILPNIKDPYNLTGVFWWSFSAEYNDPCSFLDTIIQYTSENQIEEFRTISIEEKIRIILNLFEKKSFLIILDSYEWNTRHFVSPESVHKQTLNDDQLDPYARRSFEASLASFLIRATTTPHKSHILLTSRVIPSEIESLEGVNCYKLKEWDMEEAITFLNKQCVKTSEEKIKEVIQFYGGHPLLLRLYSKTPEFSIHLQPSLGQLNHKDQLIKKASTQAFEHSYVSLTPQARIILNRLSAFRTTVQVEELSVINPFNQFVLNESIEELIYHNFVTYHEHEKCFRLHQAIRLFSYQRLDDRKKVHHSIGLYLAKRPAPGEWDLKNFDQLIPVIEQYYHLVQSGSFDNAYILFCNSIADPLLKKFMRLNIFKGLIELLFPENKQELPFLSQPTNQIDAVLKLALVDRLLGYPLKSETLLLLAKKHLDSFRLKWIHKVGLKPTSHIKFNNFSLQKDLKDSISDMLNGQTRIRIVQDIKLVDLENTKILMDLNELNRQEYFLLINYGLVLKDLNKVRRSEQLLRQAVSHQHSNPFSKVYLALLLSLKGEFEKVVQLLEQSMPSIQRFGTPTEVCESYLIFAAIAIFCEEPQHAHIAVEHASKISEKENLLIFTTQINMFQIFLQHEVLNHNEEKELHSPTRFFRKFIDTFRKALIPSNFTKAYKTNISTKHEDNTQLMKIKNKFFILTRDFKEAGVDNMAHLMLGLMYFGELDIDRASINLEKGYKDSISNGQKFSAGVFAAMLAQLEYMKKDIDKSKQYLTIAKDIFYGEGPPYYIKRYYELIQEIDDDLNIWLSQNSN